MLKLFFVSLFLVIGSVVCQFGDVMDADVKSFMRNM